MSDQTLKLAQRLIPHLGLLQHVMDLKTLAALSPLMKPPVRAALISPTSVMLVGPELTSAPMDSAQIAVCYRLVAQFKGHDGQEYAITNGELRASLTREHSRLLSDPATLELHTTLQGIATTLGAEPGETTTRPAASMSVHPDQDSGSRDAEHSTKPAPAGATPAETSPDTMLNGEPDAATGAGHTESEAGSDEGETAPTDPVGVGTEHAGETQATSTQESDADSEPDGQIRDGSTPTEDQNGARGDEPARSRRRRP